MLSYSAVFSDIDGTLLNSQHYLTIPVIQAVKKYTQANGRFVLASARPPQAMIEFADQLWIQAIFVSLNGAYLCQFDPKKNTFKTLAENPLAATAVWQFYQALKQQQLRPEMNFFCQTNWYTEKIGPRIKRESKITGLSPTLVNLKKILAPTTKIHKILCLADPPLIRQIQQLILKHPTWKLVASRSDPTYLEIVQQGVSKGQALKYLCNLWQIPLTKSLAIGDSENDLSMLQAAGFSVAPHNASPQIRQFADAIVSDNEHQAVAVMLEKFCCYSDFF